MQLPQVGGINHLEGCIRTTASPHSEEKEHSVTLARRNMFALIIAAILLAALIIFFRIPANRSSTMKVSGTIEATTVTASFKVGGRVEKRAVDEGESVNAGQLLATLDTSDLEQDVALRRADLRAANAVLAELEAGSRREEIGQARAALERVDAEEKRLTADNARQMELFKREVISTRDYEASQTSLLAIQAQVREAKEHLRLLENGPRPETIRQARARADSIRSALELARNRLADATLLAPTKGSVLAKHVEPGEMVNVGTPVVTIGDLDSVWVRSYIPETDLGRVKLGQRAKVSSDTFPGRSYDGTITFISPEAEFTPKNVQTEKERVKLVFRIKITVPNPRHELKPGMPVDAVIETGDQGQETGK